MRTTVVRATETAGIASECEQHAGLHLYEDLVITEVVDDSNRHVPPGVDGAKTLVTVLFSRTQPLIRYEMSDSVRISTATCPCGRSFRLLDVIQGRSEDILDLPSRSGGTVAIHPIVFHDVLDRVPAREWQVVQETNRRLRLLVANPLQGFNGQAVVREIQRRLEGLGAVVGDLVFEQVAGIPRRGAGRAPLVRAMQRPAPHPSITAEHQSHG